MLPIHTWHRQHNNSWSGMVWSLFILSRTRVWSGLHLLYSSFEFSTIKNTCYILWVSSKGGGGPGEACPPTPQLRPPPAPPKKSLNFPPKNWWGEGIKKSYKKSLRFFGSFLCYAASKLPPPETKFLDETLRWQFPLVEVSNLRSCLDLYSTTPAH